MEKNLLKDSSDSYPIPVHIVPSTNRENEISLADLWNVIAKHWWIILLTFLASLLLATIYVSLVKSVYKAEAYLLPPTERDIQPYLARNRGKEKSYTTDSVYKEYLKNIYSQGLRREFFDIYNIKDKHLSGQTNRESNIDKVFDRVFNENFRIQVDAPATPFTSATFSYTDAKLAAKWLNEFILFVDNRTMQQIVDGIDALIQAEIEQVRYQIRGKLRVARKRQQDRITALQEAIHMAQVLNIEEDGTLPSRSDKAKSGILVNTAQTPIYLRGSKALETEVSILKSRKSEEPFISGLRDLQEKLSYLEGFSIKTEGLSTVTVDLTARVPYRADGPRKTLIIILAALLGIIAGLFMAVAYEYWLKARTDQG